MSHVVVDYGIGNTLSVMRALKKVGVSPVLSGDPEMIRKAGRVVLPGVGAFQGGMNELKKRGIDEAIHEFVGTGRPFLGICLGMQMLLSKSLEHGSHEGLNLIPGTVIQIPQGDEMVQHRKIPHIGWNALHPGPSYTSWHTTMLEDTPVGEFYYFVHSFMAVPDDPEFLLATCVYEGLEVPAAVNKENITGCQFHPEKSGDAGLAILRNFVAEKS